MVSPVQNGFIIREDDLVLITGATGFIGSRLVETLLDRGFRNVRCFARPTGNRSKINSLFERRRDGIHFEVVEGNLLSHDDCKAATANAAVVFHLAAGRGEKSYPDAYTNSVVTTRNLLQTCAHHASIKRFVNVSSFTVYSNTHNSRSRVLDESSPLEPHPELRGEAYSFAKSKQEEILTEYAKKLGVPYVIVRPGYVYGPGNEAISGRVGIDTFGLFLHLGLTNTIPFTYVDNCAEAILLAGLIKGIDGEVFNIVDDDLPSSRTFLRLYKRNVRKFRSVPIPHVISYALCFLWEKYSIWSKGQLPPVFNTRRWHADWKKTQYSNRKLKDLLGWKQKISTQEGLMRYFKSCKDKEHRA
jgi:nucleoside-diphosphate-sugar epimerase